MQGRNVHANLFDSEVSCWPLAAAGVRPREAANQRAADSWHFSAPAGARTDGVGGEMWGNSGQLRWPRLRESGDG